ncbi:MAG TPA: DNA-binding response regulator [Herpetosiphon sp.]|uniref:Response regulator receiver protein n=1 Tax=Herpetosiphon aurantiacus (strain ATCC 23779 / DSM 785 / 114-95) TaxID=316274 RepID=A9B5C2_HERA2|nr:response regulator transcription factor [Herpetosiphon sp.]ABX02747.1 response regulator receiver protein [Herpetosiphon aurantiacus DSM 785]HBW49130.1 DNA-binding response regulator [Herpetosiphon sp.]
MQTIQTLVVEDHPALRAAMVAGLQATKEITVIGEAGSGEDAIEWCAQHTPQAILMDVALASELNGIQAAVIIRREHPRIPVVFYSIQDDDAYYRDFQRSGILSHYAYVRKSNYLLPAMVAPLLRDAFQGRAFIDPDIASRVQEVRHRDEQSALDLLEPAEREVMTLVAHGFTNDQIAQRLGFRDARAVSRINGQIYTAWGLNENTTDEKVARTRATIIFHERQLIVWDEEGRGRAYMPDGQWQARWND